MNKIIPFNSTSNYIKNLHIFNSIPEENLIESFFNYITLSNLNAFILFLVRYKRLEKMNIANYLNEGLCFALKYEGLDSIQFLLALGADPNYEYRLEKTPLRLAIHGKELCKQKARHTFHQCKHDKIISLLLTYGANPHYINKKYSPITYAAKKLDFTTIRKLFNYGATLDMRGENEKTILHNVISATNNQQLIQEFITSLPTKKFEKLVNYSDNLGKTALHLAVQKNLFETTQLLIKHGAAVNKKDKYDRTPLFYAITQLATEKNLHAQKDKPAQLLNSMHIESKKIVNFLIENNASYGNSDRLGLTALQLAVHYGLKDICEIILQHAKKNSRLSTVYKPLGKKYEYITIIEYAKTKEEYEITLLFQQEVKKEKNIFNSFGIKERTLKQSHLSY